MAIPYRDKYEAGPPVFYVEEVSSASINYMTNTWVLRATNATRASETRRRRLCLVEAPAVFQLLRRLHPLPLGLWL